MTEALPVTDITLAEIERGRGRGDGVCVGRPLPGVGSAQPARRRRRAEGDLTTAGSPARSACAAAHVKDRYDQLWVDRAGQRRDAGWHRTGDVGHLDDQGRLWVEGRLVHVVTTAAAR